MKNYSYVHFNNLLQQIATKDIDSALLIVNVTFFSSV